MEFALSILLSVLFGLSWIGVVPAAVAVGVAAWSGRREMLWFLLLIGASNLLVLMSFVFLTQFAKGGDQLVLAFLVTQVAAAIILCWRLEGARYWAGFGSLFCILYALFSCLVAAMNFSGSYL